jgi:hypothetical protein
MVKQWCEVELSGTEEKITMQKGIKESGRENNGIDHTRLNFIRQRRTGWNKTGWNKLYVLIAVTRRVKVTARLMWFSVFMSPGKYFPFRLHIFCGLNIALLNNATVLDRMVKDSDIGKARRPPDPRRAS